MCGIAGCFGDSINAPWVEKALSIMKHRGPDNTQSLQFKDYLKLGTARLAMTDPHPRSNQPFTDENKNGVVAFNGEIYNYLELKENLKLNGEHFQTQSDTEVLFKLLENYGENAIELLNGMFSFSYYSQKLNKLILSRDRLGKKPLFYTSFEGSFYWSSSLYSLTKLRNSKSRTQDLTQYLVLGYFLDPQTIYEGIFEVIPGEILVVDRDNKITRKPINANSVKPKNKNLSHNLRNEIEEAVEVRVDGHKKFALSLSGGIDSTIIALHSSKTDKHVTAYSVSWPNSDKKKYNKDSDTARIIAGKLNLNFVPVSIFEPTELRKYLHKYLIAMEEPNSNPTGLSMLYLYEKMHENDERLALTGDGADEILGGYPRYEQVERIPKTLARVLYFISKFLPDNKEVYEMRNKLHQLFLQHSDPVFWLYWHSIFNEKKLGEYIQGNSYNYENFMNILRKSIHQLDSNITSKKRFQHLMNIDHKLWLPNESNRRLDRVSMAASIEARSPFQDENVVDASQTIRENFFSIKRKNHLFSIYPELEKLGITQEKQGFISPIGYWLRNNMELIDESTDILIDFAIVNKQNIANLVLGVTNGHFESIQQLWNLVVLAAWINLNE